MTLEDVYEAFRSAIGAKWSTENVAQWVGNGRLRFAVQLQAENSVAAWQRQVRPVLVVRCIGKGVEAFVYTNSAAKMEPRPDDHTVRMTFDGDDEVSERWLWPGGVGVGGGR